MNYTDLSNNTNPNLIEGIKAAKIYISKSVLPN
ncbi:hypothetical protein OTSTA716_2181 [Orientia tsutsugamushi str. TA716]|uniref:Uncharacterized protein n=1 Tax=Orientia tsutsugamushi str. TA716 TaxID=1359175 RepID=A0A0F3NXT9_ORITS|nr:hypothetical protein OTSTA716_2181 [Orientia tsutsugamushi str. TA716]